MALFKCKMCGGNIEFSAGDTVGECDSCGTRQTLPRLDDDRRANLYDRANHFRRNNEFDKAAGIYEQILAEDATDAEAYWSRVLCRYGIEYVEDPAMHKRVPTVNRAQYTSIFEDEDYKAALSHGDAAQRALYEQEAHAINDIQKGILDISAKEEPFDVFICYKETDASGRRTQDSVLANDLYHQLTQEGFKVFFSRITLEDKLGVAYEPYIFAALNSAKVMVVLGTKPEYFNAVWVKNEWSRYLALVRESGGKKVLIPAYRDMDPYDLPEEFSHLQAQDMSKLGFMQDLIRGIKKIVSAAEPKMAKETVVVSAGNSSVEPLLKRAFMFLEDGDWASADEYCEKVLDANPENAQAYLGKLMASLQVRNREDLQDLHEPFDDNANCGKAVRFGDEALAKELRGYIEHIEQRNEDDQKAAACGVALDVMAESEALAAEGSATNDKTAAAIEGFEEALEILGEIAGYAEADEAAVHCKAMLEECRGKAEEERFERERKAEIKAERRKKRAKKAALIAVPFVAIVLTAAVAVNVVIPGMKYSNAVALMDQGKTQEALQAFTALGDYRDSVEKCSECVVAISEAKRNDEYNDAVALINQGKTQEAFQAFTALGDYKDSADKVKAICADAPVRDGDKVLFGLYEQDGKASNGKEVIEWQVLDEQNGNVLVISTYGLDAKPYNENVEDVTWEQCSLRAWLNDDFLQAAFSAGGQAQIAESDVPAHKNPEYNTDPGKDTKDKVFLLSIDEANRYFPSDTARTCKLSAHAQVEGAPSSSGSGACWWWLRSSGDTQDNAAEVGPVGAVFAGGCHHNVSGIGAARPAMWINLNS